MAKKTARRNTAPVTLPAAEAVHIGDASLVGRVYYRDASNPAGSVWYTPDNPHAKGECIIFKR